MAQVWNFVGRVVLVTGVARVGQIGHAVALAFGRAGAKLVLCDRNAVDAAARAKEFAGEGIDARPAAGDLTEPDVARLAVETAVRHFGRLDVVVNVAGGLTTFGPIEGTSAADFDREVAINLKTAFLVSQAAVPALAESKGVIVNFSSVAFFRPQNEMAVYAAAKTGVAAFTQSLALELRDRGVRVNAVAPGMVRTSDNVASVGGSKVRWVEMRQITDGVLFLASDAADAVTGHVLPITNGAL
ncbi:MAG TPA: SDR family NAD(P)-dependent oxidoreductase [Gemmatimonadales bacterium]|nr:SDR family NAD(P)-dependent oxidoreductase [Gemmatimonadales bacterium]